MPAPRPSRKRKGSPEWIRLGELLQTRRGELDARYDGHGGRVAFARDRAVNLKLIQDIELNGRENFTPLTLRDVIARAYSVTYESIRAALDGSGELVAAPDTAASPTAAGAGQPPPSAVPADGSLPPILRGLDPREIEPFLKAVDEDFAAAVSGEDDPFDDFEHGVLRNDEHTLDAKRVLLAIGRMYRAGVLPGQSRNRGTGLALASSRGRDAMS